MNRHPYEPASELVARPTPAGLAGSADEPRRLAVDIASTAIHSDAVAFTTDFVGAVATTVAGEGEVRGPAAVVATTLEFAANTTALDHIAKAALVDAVDGTFFGEALVCRNTPGGDSESCQHSTTQRVLFHDPTPSRKS